jgi:hypothetical protein
MRYQTKNKGGNKWDRIREQQGDDRQDMAHGGWNENELAEVDDDVKRAKAAGSRTANNNTRNGRK